MNQPLDMPNGWITGGLLDRMTVGLEVEVLNKIGSPRPKDPSGGRIGRLGADGIPAKVGKLGSKKLPHLGVRIGPRGPQSPPKSPGHRTAWLLVLVLRRKTVLHGKGVRDSKEADRQCRSLIVTTMMNHPLPLHPRMKIYSSGTALVPVRRHCEELVQMLQSLRG